MKKYIFFAMPCQQHKQKEGLHGCTNPFLYLSACGQFGIFSNAF